STTCWLSTTGCTSLVSMFSAPCSCRNSLSAWATSSCSLSCACNSEDAATFGGAAAAPSSHAPTAPYVSCALLRTIARYTSLESSEPLAEITNSVTTAGLSTSGSSDDAPVESSSGNIAKLQMPV